ncbi:putative FAD-containing monooxygenase [Dothidotthia symphoricarpi CBS 119687]|uniref:Putative FAD-containing monooxygenase n=1 Tax=Dothidotthia symphoricarpi CBS 119687 TaxID=1392245 RepID=A0A6A5ZUN9_9PLEO|nr:putative FAD-containing monooxygenase [Dothidotthia symphoricarpi CBS 119687]KAF2123432.1 putative FAD-containing monooxygenase [Dothidotthia symphoricarpi CBS 119687]
MAEKRHILIIGAGVSGILLAHHFKKYLSHAYTFQIVEKNHDVGGTWLENTYPGCACDVPSDIYQYSFAPTKNWSTLFASSGEIQKYLSQVVNHFNLRERVEFCTSVKRCAWDEHKRKWMVDTECNGILTTGREADFLINASGILNHYQYPDIRGLDSYKGLLIHTANWDHSVDLTGKRVSVIGAGASAVQVVPQIQPLVKQLSVYIRTPSWITTLPESFQELGSAADTSDDEYLQRCKDFESYYNMLFPVFHKDSSTQKQKRQEMASWMEDRIADPVLREKLIPNYELGCRRISPGEPFLRILQESNVKCIFNPIASCEPEGLKTQDGIEASDVIIAATGFNTSFRPRFPLLGRNNIDLRDLWRDDPASYLGLGCAGFPNYLSMLGPNCPVANGSLIGSLEAMADFVVRLLKRVDSFGVATFDPDKGAQDDFNNQVEEFMKDAVWTGNCSSWYKRGYNGKVTAVWPGSSLHYREVLEQDRWEDWHWTYLGGRYRMWGKGQSAVESADGDHSHYLKHGPLLPEPSSSSKCHRKDSKDDIGNDVRNGHSSILSSGQGDKLSDNIGERIGSGLTSV